MYSPKDLQVPIIEGEIRSLNGSQKGISPVFQQRHDHRSSSLKRQFEELESVNTFGLRQEKHTGLQISPRHSLIQLKTCDFADIKHHHLGGSPPFRAESPRETNQSASSPRWVEIYKELQAPAKKIFNHHGLTEAAPLEQSAVSRSGLASARSPLKVPKTEPVVNYNQDLAEFLHQAQEKKSDRRRKSYTSSCNKTERQPQAISDTYQRVSREESQTKYMSQQLPSRPNSNREAKSKPASLKVEDK